ncbi:MAG: XRE family transcriptional regulator [Methylococcales bacterium]|nr:XRE family transcriptional regulator [Methylococcales bacterium]
MNIDTEIRHVTPPGANLFSELGFAPDEASRFQDESQQRINAALLLKEQLMDELSKWIDEQHLKQAEAAEILKINRPRVSDLVNKKTGKFTLDALVSMLERIGKSVSLVVD